MPTEPRKPRNGPKFPLKGEHFDEEPTEEELAALEKTRPGRLDIARKRAIDRAQGRTVARIELSSSAPVETINVPTWSPDGKRHIPQSEPDPETGKRHLLD